MIRFLCGLFLLLTAGAALAQGAGPVAMVRGGEHPGFTRLTVQAQDADWRFGRDAGGYALQLSGDSAAFDLRQAFERISRARIADLRADPARGRLQIALGCSCHAIAFAYRPGLIVLDIRPGPAPGGSVFEQPLDMRPARAGETPRRYDWTDHWRDTAPAAAGTPPAIPAPSDHDLGPLRDALLARISKGVAEGVIVIADPLPKTGPATPPPPGSRISSEALPGIAASVAHGPEAVDTADGRACLTDTDLDVAGWLPPGSAAARFDGLRSQVIAEFDAPDPPRVLQAARAYIALGFGAEAIQILDLLPHPAPDPAALLRDMARVTDLHPAAGAALDGMGACDGAAALWSLLAHAAAGGTDLPPHTDLGAVTRAFAALPAHLRRHFAPALTPLLHRAQDGDALRRLRDALLRAAPPQDPAARMVDAQYRLSADDAPGAHGLAGAVLADPAGEGAAAITLLVDSAFAAGIALPAGTADRVAAFLRDADPALHAGLRRAEVLALALEGRFPDAFTAANVSRSTLPALWAMAATGADDDTFLRAAMARPDVAALPSATAQAIADRLLVMGFAQDALVWLGQPRPDWGEAQRLTAAQAHLLLRDARAALAVLAGLEGAAADTIRTRAGLQLGDMQAAAAAALRSGDPAAAARAWAIAQDLPQLAVQGAPPWQEAVALLQAAPLAQSGPLTEGQRLLDSSAAARRVIAALVFPPESQPP